MRLLGFKTLRYNHGEITSLVRPGRWSNGKLHATCFNVTYSWGQPSSTPMTGCAFPPAEECACGIWASSPYPDLAISYLTGVDRFLCVIQGIGKTLLTKNELVPRHKGFRTSEAKIIAVLFPEAGLYQNHTSVYYMPPIREIDDTFDIIKRKFGFPAIDLPAASALVEASWDWWKNNG